MAKPVFIIKVPSHLQEHIEAIRGITNHMDDYHILLVIHNNTEFKFECYNITSAKNVDIEALKERILKGYGKTEEE